MSIPANNDILKTGYIFVHIAYDQIKQYPQSYITLRYGGAGYFAKLNPNHINGYDCVTLDQYINA